MQQVLRQYLFDAFSEPRSKLPPGEEAELAALNQLSDDALWTIAREQMPADRQSQRQILMGQTSFGMISGQGFRELEYLVEQGQRLTLRKAEAGAILTRRGFQINLRDLTDYA